MKIIDMDGDRIADAEILDVSLVSDDHETGISELTGEVHWPGAVIPVDPRQSGRVD